MLHKAPEEPFFTEANRAHLADGGHVILSQDIEFDADGIAVFDGIKCINTGGYPYQSIMRYDKYLERKEHQKLCRFVDEWGYVPYELQ